MKTRLLFLIYFFSVVSISVRADEGMWLPMLISKYNIAEMQKMGLKLTAEQIYSVNQSCLKDAIVSLDHGGCSGSIISSKGLLITNHHCGFDDIAGQSTVENDYLTDGFWAMRPEEELPIPGKSVSFLVRMEDVTKIVLMGISPEMDETTRNHAVEQAVDSLKNLAIADTKYEASIESMFEGNEYYLFVYETFTDIRMVGAPPSGIGKFGGDTDNWMWPRHTGDFCLLRVYSSPSGKPATFSKENIPYSGKHFLPVSMDGVKEGDFSMIMGYPGATDRYLTSFGIKQKLNQLNPADIALKTAKMEILKKYMNQSDALRIAYASDYAYLANFQKKSIQESKALKRLKVEEDKAIQEDAFTKWAMSEDTRKQQYGEVINELKKVYEEKDSQLADVAMIYLEETLIGAKILFWAYQTNELVSSLEDKDDLEEQVKYFRQKSEEFYKNFNPQADKEVLVKMFKLYKENLPEQFYPELFTTIEKRYKNDFEKYADYLYNSSFYANKKKFDAFLDKPSLKRIMKDPAFKAANSFLASYILSTVLQMGTEDAFNLNRRKYIAGLREMYPNKHFYPDANSTLRLTYGKVMPYDPADAVEYDYFTTSKGILEKQDPESDEFRAPGRLLTLLENKEYGRYADNGHLPVCFLTTHDITGGNSGSPVMNANGELIGVAFDGNSEAMSSDIKYDANLQRTICVDIRYVLFVIDRFAGAGYLLEEMTLVNH
ncbi:MAG: S46 family peptidase [Bacteroidales bacterium]|nr:S46 family peptidase [Bacteroidales bacterium]